jgi:hypothetical protein
MRLSQKTSANGHDYALSSSRFRMKIAEIVSFTDNGSGVIEK